MSRMVDPPLSSRSCIVALYSHHRISLLFVLVIITRANSQPQVLTSLGVLRGQYLESRNGIRYAAFTSVPYAKPPVGPLRLKAPEPADPWNHVLNATSTPSPCKQFNAYQSMTYLAGEEDCLYLNVFTHQVKPNKPKAVMVYIHGGGFRYGNSGNSKWAGYFMDEHVVLVTLQYRLGALGFLSFEDAIIPGNFGLKDQALALKWIRNHIASFGGDPELITVFGESAGATSSHLQMLSKGNKGIIKGGILESGTAYALFAFASRGAMRERGIEAAKKLGCPAGVSSEALNCLQNIPADHLANVEEKFLVWANIPSIVFTPVVESSTDPNPFITEEELTAVNSIPWMGGVASNEGLFFSSFMAGERNKPYLDYFMKNLNDIFEPTFAIGNKTKSEQRTINILKNRYFSSRGNEQEVLRNFEKLIGELYFICPIFEAKKRSLKSPYLYVNDYQSKQTMRTLLGDHRDGVSHTDELQLLFDQRDQFKEINEDQNSVSKYLVKYWAKFAKYQNPTPKGNGKHKWIPSGDEFWYLKFNGHPTVEKNFMRHTREFCESLPMLSYAVGTAKS